MKLRLFFLFAPQVQASIFESIQYKANLRMNKARTSSVDEHLGEIVVNNQAAKAYKSNKFSSIFNSYNNEKVRVIFMNQTNHPLTLCWVNDKGGLHHYYKLNTSTSTVTSLSSGEIKLCHCNTHMENTFLGHSFIIGKCIDEDMKEDDRDTEHTEHTDPFTKMKKLTSSNFMRKRKEDQRIGEIIAGYRPTQRSSADDINSNEMFVHLVTISQVPSIFPFVKKKAFAITVTKCKIDQTPIDNTKKIYVDMMISGWMCKCEDNLIKDEKFISVKKRLEEDLQNVTKRVPPKACELLKKNTPIWINKTSKYGPAAAPVAGRGLCFHWEEDWLIMNGEPKTKCGGVELYEAEKYGDDADLWYGKGGVLIHELSHAYHYKFVKDGYKNEEIKACYEAAMEEKLYDAVKVHSKHGEKICRAYACSNAEEYFAELSTAFLGGVEEDECLEFNKWFPFNRKQIGDHDPRAMKMLEKLWLVTE